MFPALTRVLHRFGILAILSFVWVAPSLGLADQIFLRKEAKVAGSIVRLGDVAEIVGGSLAEKSKLNKLELFPVDPQASVLTAAQIREELTLAGVDLLRWRLSGASTVALQSSTPSSSLPTLATRAFQANRLRSQAPMHPAQQFNRHSARQVSYTAPTQVTDLTASPVGSGVQGMETSQSPGAGEEMVSGWTVRRTLDRNAQIGPMDLEPIQVPARQSRNLVTDPELLIGKVARNRLVSGQPIHENSIEEKKLVQRNKQVRIVSKVGILEVSTVGRCLADGGLGQVVPVETFEKRKPFYGTVTGYQEVTISEEPGDTAIQANRRDHQPVVGKSIGTRFANQNTGYPSAATGSLPPRVSSDRLPPNSLR